MFTVIIMGILLTLAMPSYQRYVLKTRRHAAMFDLLHMALLQEYYHRVNATYATSLEELNAPESSQFYRYSIPVATSAAFLVQADMLEAEAKNSCATLTVDEKGSKWPIECWQPPTR